MDNYVRRIIDDELGQLFPHLPAVVLEGPRGIGKTTTALQRVRSTMRLDQELQRVRLASNPDRILALSADAEPLLIDEWQRYPESWDLVRTAVDLQSRGGRFLLTGSGAPIEQPTHSGAARISKMRMRPLSLAERGLDRPTVSLQKLFSGTADVDGETKVSIDEYAEEIIKSGFPAIRKSPRRARENQIDGYISLIVERDFVEQGLRVRRPQAVFNWLEAYARATATTSSYQTILDAATREDAEKPSKSATQSYRGVLESLWMLDPVQAWDPTGVELGRLSTSPKHHLADPALAARLLGLDAKLLFAADGATPLGAHGSTMFGHLFESLIAQSLRVYAQAAEVKVFHLRDRNGEHEVDFVLEGPGGKAIAIEVKRSPMVDKKDVRHLTWLREKLGSRLVDALVVTTGPYAYRRQEDGIAVVPASLLGP